MGLVEKFMLSHHSMTWAPPTLKKASSLRSVPTVMTRALKLMKKRTGHRSRMTSSASAKVFAVWKDLSILVTSR